jgi:hypothetical protein
MLLLILLGGCMLVMPAMLGWMCYSVYDELTYEAKRAAARLEKDEDILDAVWAVEPTCGTNESKYEMYVNLMTICDFVGSDRYKRMKGESR